MRKESNLSTRWLAILAFVTCIVMAVTLALPGNMAIANAADADKDYTVELGTYKMVNNVVTFPEAKITAKTGAVAPKLMTVSVTEGSINDPSNLVSDGVKLLKDAQAASVAHTSYTFLCTGDAVTTADLEGIIQKIEFKYAENMKVTVQVDGNTTEGLADLPDGSTFFYSTVTGHYYCYVNNGSEAANRVTWTQAYNNSLDMKIAGQQGYLVTLDGTKEQDELAKLGSSGYAWIGATANVLVSNSSKVSSITKDASGNKTLTKIADNSLTYPEGYKQANSSQGLENGFNTTGDDKKHVGDYFYWVSGPTGENSKQVIAAGSKDDKDIEKKDFIATGGEPNGLDVGENTDWYKSSAKPIGAISQNQANTYENCAVLNFSNRYFNDICDRNYQGNVGASGYIVEFGGWTGVDDVKDVKVDSKTVPIELPTVSHDYAADTVTGEEMAQRVTANITIDNYNPNYIYKYQVNDKEISSKDWKDENALTVDENGVASVAGLVYGDHVKVNVYDSESATKPVTSDYFKVLTNELLNGDFEIVPDKDKTNNITNTNPIQHFYSGNTETVATGNNRKAGIYAWRTTASNKSIERWFEGHYLANTVKDNFVAELNDSQDASLYQEIKSTPGDSLFWSVNHAERYQSAKSGADVMAVVIGPAAAKDYIYTKSGANSNDLFMDVLDQLAKDQNKTSRKELEPNEKGYSVTYKEKEYFVMICSDEAKATDQWGAYNGEYIVPEGQTETVFGFTAISTAANDVGYGNIIDGVTFSAKSYKGTLTGNPVSDKTYDGQPVTVDTSKLKLTDETGAQIKIDTDKIIYTWYDADGNEVTDVENGKPVDAGTYQLKVKVSGKKNGHPYTAEETYSYTISPKSVEAKVEVADKTYDGNADIPAANIKVTVDTGVEGETLTVDGVTAKFNNERVGDDKIVRLDTDKATVTAGDNTDKDNYKVTYPKTEYASIVPATPTVTAPTANSRTYDGTEQPLLATEPTTTGGTIEYSLDGKTWTKEAPKATDAGKYKVYYRVDGGKNYNDVTPDPAYVEVEIKKVPAAAGEAKPNELTYTGEPQALVTPTEGSAELEYSTDGGKTWSTTVPTATEAGDYPVQYRVKGDANHETGETKTVTVTIAKKKVKVPDAPASKVYDGTTQTADVDVKDSDPYTVENKGGVAAKDYPVIYTLKDAKNYAWDSDKAEGANATVPFTITKAEASVTPAVGKDSTYDGTEQSLVEAPQTTDGTVWYKVNDGEWKKELPKVTDAGTYTVYTKVVGDDNHNGKELDPITVTIAPKAVSVSDADSKVYNGEKQTADAKDGEGYKVDQNEGGTDVGSYDVIYKLNDDNYKWADGMKVSGDKNEKATVQFAITKKPAAKATAPTANNRTADGSTKPLLATPATTTEGEIEYSIDGGKTWTKGIPTASKAGTYTVCYRVAGDENHEAGPVQSVTVKIAEPDYSYLLNKNVSATEKNGKLKVTWHKVPGAEGYKVYVQYCGKDFSKKSINQVKSGKATKITVTKVNGKKRNLKKNIKLYVVAYKTVNGKEKTIAKSIIMHFVGSKNKAYTNPKKITLTKSSFSLKVGKTAKIKGKVTLANPKKKGLGNDHARVLRFRSGNKKVATVSKSGKITAKGKGSCVIYVYARNGLTKEVKVTVK